MLDRLSRHPATARHVSTQLAQYFLGDAPPPALVERMAKRWLATDGDIAEVTKVLLTAPEYDASRASTSRIRGSTWSRPRASPTTATSW